MALGLMPSAVHEVHVRDVSKASKVQCSNARNTLYVLSLHL